MYTETLPKSCKEAKSIESKQYFTGKPCKHGHIAPRFTASNECAECARLRCVKRRKSQEIVEKLRDYSSRYNDATKEERNLKRREKLRKDGEYKRKEKERQREWVKKNKWYFRNKWAKDQATRRKAKTLVVNKELTVSFCSECPDHLTIDHIIPVSKGGVHDISNLQYLTSSDNSAKKDGCNIPVNGIYCLPCDPYLHQQLEIEAQARSALA